MSKSSAQIISRILSVIFIIGMAAVCFFAARAEVLDDSQANHFAVCAPHDLELVTMIETYGDQGIVAKDFLIEASGDLLSARAHCSDGEVDRAFALYQRAILRLESACRLVRPAC